MLKTKSSRTVFSGLFFLFPVVTFIKNYLRFLTSFREVIIYQVIVQSLPRTYHLYRCSCSGLKETKALEKSVGTAWTISKTPQLERMFTAKVNTTTLMLKDVKICQKRHSYEYCFLSPRKSSIR